MVIELSRWLNRAVEESAKQIYGAERYVRSTQNLVRADGSTGLPFPKTGEQKIHRIAVGTGSRGNVPLPFGDLGKGFVRVLDEISARTLLSELLSASDRAILQWHQATDPGAGGGLSRLICITGENLPTQSQMSL
jgi:hypothetical protein